MQTYITIGDIIYLALNKSSTYTCFNSFLLLLPMDQLYFLQVLCYYFQTYNTNLRVFLSQLSLDNPKAKALIKPSQRPDKRHILIFQSLLGYIIPNH